MTRRERGKEDKARQRQHQHLRAHAAAATVDDEGAPGSGEAERRVIQNDTCEHADEKEPDLPADDHPPILNPSRSGSVSSTMKVCSPVIQAEPSISGTIA